MRGPVLLLVVAMLIAAQSKSAHSAQRENPGVAPVRYIDVHSHLMLPNVPVDDEIALFKKGGVAAVVIMHSDPAVLQSVVKSNRGYVIPFISVSRLPGSEGLRLDANTADTMKQLLDAGAT